MRGLFCCFPMDYIYNFSVYGFQEQAFPFAKQMNPLGPSPLQKQDIFSVHWLFANRSPLLPLSPELQLLQQNAGEIASKLSDFSLSNLSLPTLRFSKYSLISTMNSFSDEQLESGLCLSLCRVLIIKQKTIHQHITDQDIIEASQQQYDALFSSKR